MCRVGGNVLYLWRLKLTPSTRWGGLFLHVFHRGDEDRHLHDHPWNFWTFPLVSYNEEWGDEGYGIHERRVHRFRLHYRKATFNHRIMHPRDGRKIVTLVWHGPKIRSWGFWTEEGWVPWRRYLGHDRS